MKVCPSCNKEKKKLATVHECEACYLRRRRKENPEYFRAKENKQYHKHREKNLIKMREYRAKNLERLREYDKNRWLSDEKRRQALLEYRKDNTDRIRETDRQEYRRNKDKHIARVMRRRARRGLACPKWLSKEQLKQMQDIYRDRPENHHVDHIVPLQGPNVCGLHVPWNLQYLPASENLKKGNKCP